MYELGKREELGIMSAISSEFAREKNCSIICAKTWHKVHLIQDLEVSVGAPKTALCIKTRDWSQFLIQEQVVTSSQGGTGERNQ